MRAVEGLMYLAPACSFWLLSGMSMLEWGRMMDNNALGRMAAKPAWYMAASAMGFTVNILSFLVIQQLSSLTLKVRVGRGAIGYVGYCRPGWDWGSAFNKYISCKLPSWWLRGLVLVDT